MAYTSNKTIDGLDALSTLATDDKIVVGDTDDTSRAKGITKANLMADIFTSPALTGNPTAPTQSASDNSTKIATTAYVDNQVVGVSIQTFTSSGTWTKPSGAKAVTIICTGAGGGGASKTQAGANGATGGLPGGGGGGGGGSTDAVGNSGAGGSGGAGYVTVISYL